MGSNRFMMMPREIERGDHTDALDRSAERLEALAWMLYTALREGAMEQHADGIASLLENEAAMIVGTSEAVAEMREENRDLKAALGEKVGAPEEAWREDVRDLREAIVAEKLREGVEPQKIGAAMNMQATRMEAVMAKLRAEPTPPTRRRAAS